MSKVEVNQVTQQCGTTLTVGGGACKTAVVDATTVTLGRCGGTVSLASGATQSGFGRTGTVDWITTPKVTGDSPITGVTGKGYFLDTTAGTITLNLPAGAAGSIVSMADYAATWQTNNVTVAANGSEKIGGDTTDVTLNTEGQSVTLVYIDSTQGWINTMDSTSNVRGIPPYIAATGGTPACGTISGDYKIHTFTGPGTFCVSRAAVCAADNLVSYMVVAGGGSGGNAQGGLNGQGGGAGAGGFRELVSPTAPYTASPLDGYPNAPNRITVSATPYAITVGGGGPSSPTCSPGVQGSNSVFSTITSTGGGYGSASVGGSGAGGSGGGASNACSAGNGNTPPTTPSQGNNGGASFSPGNPCTVSGGGGGAVAVGGNGNPGGPAGNGGAGATSCITASPVVRAGGGGGGGNSGQTGGGTGGTGGGGAGGTFGGPACGVDGLVNTGGGGGATAANCGSGPATAGAGGSGIVVIRYKFQ